MIRILVDSSSDYTMEEIKEQEFSFVPLNILISGKSYRDVVDLIPDDFYKLLISSKDFPKTSQPSPQDFAEIFEDVKAKGDEIICILLSSALSGTCQSAHLAKDMVDYDGIHIIDSLAATAMIKFMGNHAAKLVKEGLSAQEIVQKIEAMKGKIKVVAGLDTLEYLCKGGRLSKASATIGELANLKPIITVTEEGKVSVIGKCLGKNKALNFILKYLENSERDMSFPLYTLYSFGTENTEKLEERLTKEGISYDERVQLGSTIGAHIGPGAFAILYVIK